MAEEISVNLMLVCGKGYNLSYLFQGREVDKSDLYASRPDLFQPGKYPFYWPGNVAIFGGHISDGETPQTAFKREVKEELDLDLNDESVSKMELRTYKWGSEREKIMQIVEESNEIFQGNVNGFLGFSFSDRIPECVLGKDRKRYEGKNITYSDWIFGREEDHYFAANIGGPIDLTDREGAGAIWLPHWVARSICTVPLDKIALLDDMTKRIKLGELEIKVKRK